eukprot:4819494-Pyramimonas_sp.AAC.1
MTPPPPPPCPCPVSPIRIRCAPAPPSQEFECWIQSCVCKDFGGQPDDSGLYDGGWRVGSSICARWPSMPHLEKSQNTYFYKCGGSSGTDWDLCKVSGMCKLTPWAIALARLAVSHSRRRMPSARVPSHAFPLPRPR